MIDVTWITFSPSLLFLQFWWCLFMLSFSCSFIHIKYPIVYNICWSAATTLSIPHVIEQIQVTKNNQYINSSRYCKCHPVWRRRSIAWNRPYIVGRTRTCSRSWWFQCCMAVPHFSKTPCSARARHRSTRITKTIPQKSGNCRGYC